MNNRQIGIGLMGLGVIGSGVARALRDKAVTLEERAAAPVILKKILEIDTTKHGTLGLDRGLFTTDFQSIIGDPEIDVVIELIGGENPAYDFISKALSAGKHVVTANKELMAKHGYELLSMARTHKVYLRFEASVGGGIPLIAPFQRDLVVNDVLTIYGILNGTTNYILTRMADDGLDFDIALKQAQELGYAEADPSNDIEGRDTAYKLAVLASIAFNTRVTMENVYYEGIACLQARDFRYAKELNYAIKLLAIAKQADDSIEVRVHPVFISEDSLLAKVSGVYNAVDVEGDLVGNVIFYGQGAGPSATSSAVVADVVNIAYDIVHNVEPITRKPGTGAFLIKPMDEIATRYYIRMGIIDQSGVLAQIAKVLGDHDISIASVIQKESDVSSQTAEIVIMTHPAQEKAMQDALKAIERLDVCKEINNLVRVED